MSGPADQHVIERTVAALQQSEDALGTADRARLNAASRAALEAAGKPRVSVWMWASAGAAAAALALAIGLGNFNGNGTQTNMLAQQVLAEPELYEEMEFYLWLSAELEEE